MLLVMRQTLIINIAVEQWGLLLKLLLNLVLQAGQDLNLTPTPESHYLIMIVVLVIQYLERVQQHH